MKRIFLIAGCICSIGVFAQTVERTGDVRTPLPLRKVSLFSSGVGFFEHSGMVNGNATVQLSFEKNAMNDALKSLVVNDEEAGLPQVSYLSESTLQRTLQSLKIDLSGESTLVGLLNSLQGTEVSMRYRRPQTQTEETVRGRIVIVDSAWTQRSPILTLSTESGIKTFDFVDITGFSIDDPSINSDLGRALDLLRQAKMERTQDIGIHLEGRRKRQVTVSYVIPTPLWKITYRLDLNQRLPLLQSWVIIDNDGDIDWNNVEVSLVSGKPVSFVQDLYPPYYTDRPTLPLAGADLAQARTYDSGWDQEALTPRPMSARMNSYSQAEAADTSNASPKLSAQRASGAPATAAAVSRQAGEQFEFTLKKPVTLQRQQSTMLPLFDGRIDARKILVFSGLQALGGALVHPVTGAELSNTTGMKLPAGSITVFSGNTYAGDALLDFVSINEKRIIAYGEDLSVSGSVKTDVKRTVSTAKISQGLVTLNRKQLWNRTYSIRNASAEAKRLVIEHPITRGATLVQPLSFSEQTATLYRFEMDLRGNELLTFDVSEESPSSETLVLSGLSPENLLAYSNNSEIDEKTRAVFREALRLKNTAADSKTAVSDLERRRSDAVAEQERVRANLQAVGNQTSEGAVYLSRLTALDGQIAKTDSDLAAARLAATAAQTAYDNYIANLEL